jgi:hypothetical protein
LNLQARANGYKFYLFVDIGEKPRVREPSWKPVCDRDDLSVTHKVLFEMGGNDHQTVLADFKIRAGLPKDD